MNRTELIARFRQIQSQERNAMAVYEDLAANLPDASARADFQTIAEDERRHAALEQELILLLQSHG